MSTPDGCAFSDVQPHGYNHLITTINPPSTVMLCDEHYPAGLIPLLAAELGLEPGDLYATIERSLKRAAREADKAVAGAHAAEAAQGSDSLHPQEHEEIASEHEETASEHEETGLFYGSGEEAL